MSAQGEPAACYVGLPEAPGLDVLQLIPQGGWWIAHVTLHPRYGRCVAIDVCTPPRFADGVWSYDDLELDVIMRGPDVAIEDEDEFEAGCAAGLITTSEAECARAAAIDVKRLLLSGAAPFDDDVWGKLEAACALPSSPITAPIS